MFPKIIYYIAMLANATIVVIGQQIGNEYHPLDIFQTFLKPLSSCLVQITNHERQTIPELQFPVIVRRIGLGKFSKRMKYLKYIKSNSRYHPKFHIRAPNSRYKIEVDMFGNHIHKNWAALSNNSCQQADSTFICNRSSLIHGGPDQLHNMKNVRNVIYNLCTKIDYISFSAKSRPWKCEAHVEYLPAPNLFSRDLSMVSFWFWRFSNSTFGPSHLNNDKIAYTHVTQNSLPTFRILITNEWPEQKQLMTDWARFVKTERKWSFGNLDVLIFLPFKIGKRGKVLFHKLIVKVDRCYNMANPKDFFNSGVLSTALEHPFKLIEKSMLLGASHLNDKIQCDLLKRSSHLEKFRYALAEILLEDLLHFSKEEMLQTVFANITTRDYCTGLKMLGKTSATFIAVDLRPVTNQSIPTHFSRKTFRFLSCGRAHGLGLPFEELIYSYDECV